MVIPSTALPRTRSTRTRRFAPADFAWRSCLLLLAATLPGAVGCATLSPRSWFGGDTPPADSAAASSSSRSADGVSQASYEKTEEERKLEELTWSDLQPTQWSKAVKKATGYGPNRAIARDLYSQAEDLYKQAAAKPENERRPLFVAAGEKYVEAAERWPGSAIEQDALFMAGESYFFADYYPKANDCYEKLIKAFPNNRYLDTVDQRRFAIARYWLEENRKNPESWYAVNLWDQERPWRDTHGYALRVYDKIRVDDPTGRLADDATLAAANEHFANRKFQKADEYYTDLRTAYPTSEHQFTAHFLGLKTKLMSYLGPDYGAGSLDDAEKLIKQIKRQFPREYAAEQEFIDRAAAEVRYKKAEKLFGYAQYFDGRSEYRAAGHYYQRVMNEYNDTPFAERSQARLQETSQLPPKPEQYVPWLVDAFPKRDKIQRLLDSVEDYEQQNPRPDGAAPSLPEGSSQVLPASAQTP
jgi:outer membrane protein assembly factor BamD (BamD/ComL family)